MEENKTIELGKEFDEVVADIDKPLQDETNQLFINGLRGVIRTNSTVPTHTPKKFIDCFYLYFDGSSTYKLYIYIQNSWKEATLS